jgi:drug/metabolite transporter (DMT)-like permease
MVCKVVVTAAMSARTAASIEQLVVAIMHYAHLKQILQPAADRKRLLRDVLLVLASGAFLGVHFSFWVWVSPLHSANCNAFQHLSLKVVHNAGLSLARVLLQAIHHTSLTHALLFSSAAPLLIAIGTLIMRKPISIGKLLICLAPGNSAPHCK